ncbi:Dixin-A [Nymphon striatum]|nr:Dixin-A [Nymphon striatum]
MRRSCHFEAKWTDGDESPDAYYNYEALETSQADYESMSPNTSAYNESMPFSDTSDFNGNITTNNNEYMSSDPQVCHPDVILLDCDDEKYDHDGDMKPSVTITMEQTDPLLDEEQEVLQDKGGVEMETNEQSTQISENIGNVEDSNCRVRLQEEIESHERTREECEIISQESEKLQEINRGLSKRSESKDDEIIKLKALLNSKDQQIKRQRSQFDDTLKNLTAANKVKSNLTNRISDQDKQIARLELHSQSSISTVSPARQQCAIQPNSPCEINSVQPGSHLNYDSTGDPKRSPITKIQGNDRSLSSEEGSDGWTKVLYYTERFATPYLFHIPKRIGEITLKDFKDSFDRPGLYRFHFKTIDPEFGMVKEEVVRDNDIVPGLEGKVIAWVEEDV